jgi:predicted aspartyl protease
MKFCVYPAAILAALMTSAMVAIPAQAKDCQPLKMYASIPLSASEDGRRYYVPVQIGGLDKRLILDTGAEISEISEELAKTLNLRIHTTPLHTYDVTGKYSDRFTKVPFKIGRLNLGESDFMVVPALNHTAEADVVGLLGADFLMKFDVSLDPSAKKLDLLSPEHCPDKVVYWPASAIARVPVECLRYGHLVVDIELDDKPFRAILDTGAWQSTIRIQAARKQLGVEHGGPDSPPAGELNGTIGLTTYRHVFKTLSFEGVTVANPTIQLIPDMLEAPLSSTPTGLRIKVTEDAAKPEMLLGMDILRHLHLYIAYKDRFVYLTPIEPPSQTK